MQPRTSAEPWMRLPDLMTLDAPMPHLRDVWILLPENQRGLFTAALQEVAEKVREECARVVEDESTEMEWAAKEIRSLSFTVSADPEGG